MRGPKPQYLALALSLTSLLALAACRERPSSAWPLDVWSAAPEIETYPFGDTSLEPVARRTVTLGATEVRDLSRVSPDQLKTYPQESSGQIHALEQLSGSRLKWHTRIGANAYFSYVPLGAGHACPCAYRVSVGRGGRIEELARTAVRPAASPRRRSRSTSPASPARSSTSCCRSTARRAGSPAGRSPRRSGGARCSSRSRPWPRSRRPARTSS